MDLPRFDPNDLPLGPLDNGASSMIEFHSPQVSQRPDHLEWDAPQAVQENVCALTMAQGCRKVASASTHQCLFAQPGFGSALSCFGH